MDHDTSHSPSAGTAFRLTALLADIGRVRLQLAAVELEQERMHLAQCWLAAAWTLGLMGLTLLLACGWAVMAAPAPYRLAVLGGLTAVSALAVLAAALHWHRKASRKPPLLSATLAELQRDAEALRLGGLP